MFLFKIKTLSFEHILRILSSLWLTKVLVKYNGTHSLVIILKTLRPTGTEGSLQHLAELTLFSRFLGSFVSYSEKNPLMIEQRSLF